MEQLPALLVLIAARLAEPREVTTAADRPDETLLTADDVAERLSVKPTRVYELARRGEIEFQPIGRYKRFTPDAVERYSCEGTRGGS